MQLSVKHLLGIRDVPRQDIELILDTATQFKEVLHEWVLPQPWRSETNGNHSFRAGAIKSLNCLRKAWFPVSDLQKRDVVVLGDLWSALKNMVFSNSIFTSPHHRGAPRGSVPVKRERRACYTLCVRGQRRVATSEITWQSCRAVGKCTLLGG